MAKFRAKNSAVQQHLLEVNKTRNESMKRLSVSAIVNNGNEGKNSFLKLKSGLMEFSDVVAADQSDQDVTRTPAHLPATSTACSSRPWLPGPSISQTSKARSTSTRARRPKPRDYPQYYATTAALSPSAALRPTAAPRRVAVTTNLPIFSVPPPALRISDIYHSSF